MSTHDLFGLDVIVDGKTSFELTPPLVRFDRQLFGGTGLAVTTAAAQQATGRDAVWATVQFVGTAQEGERLDVHVEEVARGGTVSQIRVTASVGGRLVLAGLASTARERTDGFFASFATMPVVPDPNECGPLTFGFAEPPPEMLARGPFSIGEYRVASTDNQTRHLWVHLRDRPFNRVLAAYIADFVPSAVLQAAGKFGGGTSLDNAMRFGPPVPEGCEWLLLESDPYFAHNGFVHGAARIWTPDGVLVAMASQSAIARIFGG